MHDAGETGSSFVPSRLNFSYEFWETVVLPDHPDKVRLLSYLKHDESIFDLLTGEFRGPSRQCPYSIKAFPGVSSPNCIPATHAEFVRTGVARLVKRGCLVQWEDVRGPTGPARPRLVLPMLDETTKPRLVIDARRLYNCCRHVSFTIATVAKVAVVAEEDVFVGSLDDRSEFHNLGLQPESWPLLGVTFDGVDYCCTTVPFGWNESPFCYHALSETKATYLRSRGVPTLANIDAAWLAIFNTIWRYRQGAVVSGRRSYYLGMLVAFCCGCFLSPIKCDLKPLRI